MNVPDDMQAMKAAAYEKAVEEERDTRSPIEASLYELEAAVERCHLQATRLIERLQPILLPAHPSEGINAVPLTSEVELVARISRQTRALHELADRLMTNHELVAL